MSLIRKDEAALERAVVKMARAAEQFGLTPDDLIKLVESGMSVEQLFEYLLYLENTAAFLLSTDFSQHSFVFSNQPLRYGPVFLWGQN